MIDEDRTMQLYGYISRNLPSGSHKSVIAVCEECGKYRVIQKSHYRDLCLLCSRHTDEYRKIQSKGSTGANNPMKRPEVVAKVVAARRRNPIDQNGVNNPNWKGGITSTIDYLRNSKTYANWRTSVFVRDNYTCALCNVRGGSLNAHHIHPVRDNKNTLLLFDVDNGITLCEKCHDSTKMKEYEYVDFFKSCLAV